MREKVPRGWKLVHECFEQTVCKRAMCDDSDTFLCFSLLPQRSRSSDRPRLGGWQIFFTLCNVPPSLFGNGFRQVIIRKSGHDFSTSQTREAGCAAFIAVIQV